MLEWWSNKESCFQLKTSDGLLKHSLCFCGRLGALHRRFPALLLRSSQVNNFMSLHWNQNHPGLLKLNLFIHLLNTFLSYSSGMYLTQCCIRLMHAKYDLTITVVTDFQQAWWIRKHPIPKTHDFLPDLHNWTNCEIKHFAPAHHQPCGLYFSPVIIAHGPMKQTEADLQYSQSWTPPATFVRFVHLPVASDGRSDAPWISNDFHVWPRTVPFYSRH